MVGYYHSIGAKAGRFYRKKEEKRKTKGNMVRQQHSVDRYGLRKSTPSNGQQKSMEKKNDPWTWCGQRWDRGWLKSSQVKILLKQHVDIGQVLLKQ